MAKQQTFADKAAKLGKKALEITCPKCNKSSKVLYAKVVNSVKTEKSTWKYLERNAKLCSNCLAEL
jgi:DNA-directed RNA polymerase subunit RPC12/RpoP